MARSIPGKGPTKPPGKPAIKPPTRPPPAGTSPPSAMKPPPTSRIGLTEVERAISLLEGRHPEHEKIARQTREGVERRRGEIALELEQRARVRRLRAAIVVVVVAAAGGTGFVALRFAQGARAVASALDAARAPWLARGFTPLASNALTATHSLEADLPGSSCFVAVGTEDVALTTTLAGAPATGMRSLAWCACAPEHVRVDAQRGSKTLGLAILSVEGGVLGGPLARAWTDFAPGAWAEPGGPGIVARQCGEAMLDAWIEGRHTPTGAPLAAHDDPWLSAAPRRAALRRAGFRVAAAIDPVHPFAIVGGAGGDCMLAVADGDATLSLREAGGARLLANVRGALAWCNAGAATTTVWRDGAAPVAVLAVPATRIGGLLGTRESAESAGLHVAPESTWLRSEDLAWDASALLRASTMTEVTTGTLAADPSTPDARVVALAMMGGANVVSAPETTLSACDPPLAELPAGAPLHETLCAPSAPVAWLNRTDAAAGIARSPLPFWLAPLQGHHEADAIARIPELLGLARRLAREGFEPTTLEGITELPAGIRIIGRAGEDAVVAIGLTPKPPWALPYFDKVPWDLGDEPAIVPLEPGEEVTLTSSPLPATPLKARRTVVFRHAEH